MAKDFSANPKDVNNFTTTSEVNLDQHIQDYSEFLPAVNRNESLERFFGATVNQLLSSGSTQSIDAYWGRLAGRNYNPNNEQFQPEPSATRQNYQFQPGVVSRLEGETQQTTSYINWLDRLHSLGSDLTNHDRVFSEPGYVLDVPVNIDMMINYANYYWLEGEPPLIVIEPATAADTIDIDTIVAQSQYTTPVLGNYRSVEFVTGLRVQFTGPYITSTSGEYFPDSEYYVENVGGFGGIRLVEIRNAAGADLFPRTTPYYVEPREGWDTVPWDTTAFDGTAPFPDYDVATTASRDDLNLNKSYIVMERWASDKNAWARTNRWFSIHALRIATEFNSLELEAYLNTRTRANRPILEFNANMELFNHCKNLRAGVTFELSIEQVTELLSGVSEFFVDPDNAIQVGDTILVASDEPGGIEIVDYNEDYGRDFLAGPNAAGAFNSAFSQAYSLGAQLDFANGAYTVIDDGGVFGLEPVEDPDNPGNPIVFEPDDYVIVGRGSQKGQIFCFDGELWTQSQTKETRGTAPLFQLYDENLVALEDFPENNFQGDKIFGYKETPTGAFDRELGFKPSFTDQGSFANYEFEWTLGNNRYSENVTVSSREEIRGFYYWQDCVTLDYYNGWSNIRGGQRVPIIQTQIADGVNPVTFELGSTATGYATEYTVSLENGEYRWFENNYIDRTPVGYANPEFIWKYDTEYTINDLISVPADKLEFVDPLGGTANITATQVSDTLVTLQVASAYEFDKVNYRKASDPTVFGEIFLTDINQERYSIQQNGQYLRDGVDYTVVGSTVTITAPAQNNDVFELQYIADADLENVVYDVAPVHFYNSDNNPFTVVGYDDLTNHFTRQLVALPGFEGEVTGVNNYHRIRHLHTYDGLIRQQIFQTKNVQYLLDQEAINPIRALKSFNKDYADFKQFFINKVEQLWRTQGWSSVRELVDQALSEINIGKNEEFKYAHSDMAYFKQGRTTVYFVEEVLQTVFELPQTVSQYGDTQNHLQVWAQQFDTTRDKIIQTPLVNGIDYTIEGPNIILTNPLQPGIINVIDGLDNVIDGPNNVVVGDDAGSALILRWFDYKQISNIPFSAVKLGFFKPTQVEIVDGELIGHDGSRYTLTGTDILDLDSVGFDVVGAALYDYELRVFNNLVDKHFVGDTLKNDMRELYPNPVGEFAYDVDDLTVRLDDWYNRWTIRNGVTEIDDVDYDAGDQFTWNYNTVGPMLGSWRSLYVYEFGTDRPHTHPWEMLGHHVKPTWWDVTYSWTAGPLRVALLNALKYGITGNATTANYIDIRYARPNFDWDTDTLVTDDGTATLNPPVTAGVVTAPSSVDAAHPFVFGDWSEIENVWRKSSDYLFALAEVYLQLKPYRTHELFWMLDRWEIRQNVTQEQWIDPDTCFRTHIEEIHNELITDGIISEIIVLDGGTGYTFAELDFVAGLDCYSDLLATAWTNTGNIVRVSIDDPGRGFNSDPVATVIGPLGASGDEFEYRIDFNFVVTHLGFNSLPAEEFRVNTRYTNELATTIADLDLSYMLHVGGYTDKRIIAVEIDGDFASGLIRVPESSYDIKIDRNAPIKTAFYSGVKIEKLEGEGYRVDGYNLDSKFFNYLKPSTAGQQIGVTVGGVEVIRYKNWRNEVSRLPYRSVFVKRQDLYQFLLGLGQYYDSVGFDATAQWEVEARQAIEWSLDRSQTDPFYVNGIDGTLTYQQGSRGTLQTIDVNYDGVPNVLDEAFKNIRRNELLVLRDETQTEIGLKSTEDRLFGVGVRVVEFEHIITLDNITTFNDPIYQPEIGIGQNRVRLVGERTRNWNGRIEAPGYLVEDTGLILNFESSVRELETEWVTAESKALERLTRQTIGFNVGYSKPTYMTNTFIGDKSAYRFEKGERNYQGTELAIEAMTRNKNIFGEEFEHQLYEEWMVRLGEYGDVSESRPIQFAVNPDKIKTDPQHYRLNKQFVSDKLEDLIIDISEGSEDAISGNYEVPFDVYDVLPIDNTSIENLKDYQEFTRDAGLPLVTEIDNFLGSIDDIGDIYDPTQEYALIPNWTNTTAYVQGERVRLDGKVYRLRVESTGLTGVRDDVVIRGTQVFPTVANQLTFIANDTTVTFTKFDQNVTFDQINVDGTVTEPTVPSGDTLVLDGINIDFIKNETVTTFSDIVLEGDVSNPTIQNGPGVTVDIGYANTPSPTPLTVVSVPFEELDPNLIMQTIWVNALTTAGAATPSTLTASRITALENLRLAYVSAESVAAWQVAMGNYYDSTTTPNLYLNSVYWGNQINAQPAAVWRPQAEILIQLDLDLIAELSGSPATETVLTMISGVYNDPVQFATDRDNANNLLDPLVTANNDNENLRDFRTFVVNNGSTAIANGTLVPVSNPINYVTDGLIDIVNKINTQLSNSGAPVTITASPSGNIVTITRNSNLSGYRLGVATNTDLGFTVADNDVETQGNTITGPVDLTLDEAVQVVNNARLTGVTAQSTTDRRMRIVSTNETLAIGTGSANNDLGFSPGTFQANSNSTTVPVDLAIGDVVTQINAANIENLTASQVEGALLLTYNGEQLVIGEGTANADLGIVAGTYESLTEAVDNVFNEDDWDIVVEPANFNIWTIDNIGSNPLGPVSTTNRYDVLQTIDFQIGAIEICAGSENGDDALIFTTVPHTLSVGEYVLIVNSTCVPSVDGIHQVTSIQDEQGFFIDRYIEEKGFTGKVFPLRSVRFPNNFVAQDALADEDYVQGSLGLRTGSYVYADTVLDKTTFESQGFGAVYQVERTSNGVGLNLVRFENGKTNNSTIKNGVLYSNKTGQTVIRYEVYDPLKGIIPGIAEREIDLRSDVDFAYYNQSTNLEQELREENAWGQAQVGNVWWDLSTAIYLNYDQDTPEYRQEYWGALFPTATIDIYEWTKSPVTPDEYATAVQSGTIIDGTELTGIPYGIEDQFGEIQYNWCEELELNTNTNQLETYFYFWVRNKTTTPNIDRTYSVLQLTDIILDPASQRVDWLAATGGNTVLISSLSDARGFEDLVMQINFDANQSEYHQEFALLGEGDPQLIMPEWLHISLRDSLAGYTQGYTDEPFAVWNDITIYSPGRVVKSLIGNFYRCHTEADNINPDGDTNNDFWTRLQAIEENPDGDYENSDVVRLSASQIIPDRNLHPVVRYGIETRPHQTWFVDLFAARKTLVEKINIQLETIDLVDSDIPWREEFERTFSIGDLSYDITEYWNFIDWSRSGFIFERGVGDYFLETEAELFALPNPQEGEIAQVETSKDSDGRNRRSVWSYENGEWAIVYKEKATIRFNTLLWNSEASGTGWDVVGWDTSSWDDSVSAVVVEIFNSFYYRIWTEERYGLYADLWFYMAKHVISEQQEVDWIFKSSYFKLITEDNLEKQFSRYFDQNVDEFFDYVNIVKPFRSKLRDSVVRKLADEDVNLDLDDSFELRIQTNPNDNIIDEADTRSFRLTVGANGVNNSSQIIDKNKVLLGIDIGPGNLIIPYLNSGNGTLPSAGAFWINGERMEYSGTASVNDAGIGSGFTNGFNEGFGGVTLLNVTARGTNGTFARAHSFADVIEYEWPLVEPDNLPDNGDDLDLAWNTPGLSLLDPANVQPNSITINGTPLTITGITNANPANVTLTTTAGLQNGDMVVLTDIVGMTELNFENSGEKYIVSNLSATTFELQGVDSTAFGAYTSGGGALKDRFGTIDLYSNILYAQWLALQEPASAIQALQNELRELIEVYWAQNTPWWTVDQNFVTIDQTNISIDGPGIGI